MYVFLGSAKKETLSQSGSLRSLGAVAGEWVLSTEGTVVIPLAGSCSGSAMC